MLSTISVRVKCHKDSFKPSETILEETTLYRGRLAVRSLSELYYTVTKKEFNNVRERNGSAST